MFAKAATAAVLLTSVLAQRPTNTSICDYYTTALLKNNTAANQAAVLTLVVNTVVVGNYSTINVGIPVPGILAKGNVNGTVVDLLPYFDGGLASTNRNGKAVAVNFLDDGGAAPLLKSMPANGKSSNQYFLLTHLYQFFGSLLGCSQQGMAGFDAYGGQASMASVHQFMNLDSAQMTYFITQVGLAAASFGVTQDDATAVGKALESYFDLKCAPAVKIIPAQGAQLQAICQAADCTTSPNATCSSYIASVEPAVANATLADGQGNSTESAAPAGTGLATESSSPSAASATGTGTATGTMSGTPSATHSNAAGRLVGGAAAGGLALFAFLL